MMESRIMTHFRPQGAADRLAGHARIGWRTCGLTGAVLLFAAGALGQDAQTAAPPERIQDGYAVHQTIDVGGRAVDSSGSGAMYDTLVNLQSGPRILSQSINVHAVAGTYHPLFVDLMESRTRSW